ncbi:MAG TPA: hypothetical protein VEB64_01645 [Azospirillaceae bacterium]|nr:hypothetical protein [Azospirillaceae bacterium]
MSRLLPLVFLLLSACAVVDVAGTAVSTAVSVTGTVVSTTTDVVTSPLRSDDDEKKE